MPGYTPMMEQYFALKNQYPDCLLFFRLGDFYEMFFDDALTASQALDITLTGRDCGQAERAPMCGVPFHAADGYIAKLVEKGYHVAICEQTEDPKQAKGLVKREVIRVVTPGTVTDAHMLDEKKHNYIVCLHKGETHIGCAAADVTTGLFTAAAIPEESENRLADELTRLMPAEMLISEGFPYRAVAESIAGIKAAPVPAWTFHQNNAFKCLTQHFKTHHLEGFGLSQNAPEIPAAGALMQYLYETQKSALPQITSLKIASQNTRMTIDGPSRRNLELTQSASGQKGKKLSLFGILDFTKTAMGARALRGWVEQPLLSPEEINKRLDSVEEWFKKPLLRAELRELLQSVHDLERLIAKLAGASANARDLSALRASVKHLPHIGTLLSDAERDLNAEIYRTFDDLSDIYAKIDGVITDEPPVSIREGGMIRRGCDAELDRLLDVKENGGKWLSELEAREREQTGIKNLKIRHNKVFGYYIEITNSQLQNAPERYVRRQTLANCERFITEELKDLEDTILGADEKQTELEYRLFDTLRREIVEEIARIQFMAYELAALDALQSLANAAERGGYVKPAVSGGGSVVIK
ncbi:MAG: DNA mismatch repair protein MutS, partial [Clostridiales bacterium]|nr:DNA mismatch repair protein MutS [Clostridiales bacterium]